MSDIPEIELNGRIYDGWQKCSINMSIKDIASSFALTVDDFSPEDVGDMSVKISCGGERLLTGWLDRVDTSTVPDREGTRISGRSKTGDLVDCAAIVQGGELRNASLIDACRELCKPFGVGVEALSDTGDRFDRIKIEQGETVSQVIDRISRERGFNAWASVNGGIVLGRPGSDRSDALLRYRYTETGQLRSDNNIVELSGSFDMSGRFSKLVMRSQAATSDMDFGLSAAQSEAIAIDEAVKRYRPAILTSDGAGSSAQLKARVEWEASRRIGLSTGVSYQVEGWRQVPGGAFWKPGLVVPVEDEKNNISYDMLIVSVSLTLDEDDGGYRASLSLEPKAAWVPKPVFKEADGDAQYAALRAAVRG
ncbi:MAG: phage baseplate assembly protein [Thalassospira sp.]|uniref:phage baseplate assembly protein n=1 Tax=Thalassospira sp. TaxID=1912094 RepID=UPI003A886C78